MLDPTRWKLAHRLLLHRVDTWLACGPYRTPGLEWHCVTCWGTKNDRERKTP